LGAAEVMGGVGSLRWGCSGGCEGGMGASRAPKTSMSGLCEEVWRLGAHRNLRAG